MTVRNANATRNTSSSVEPVFILNLLDIGTQSAKRSTSRQINAKTSLFKRVERVRKDIERNFHVRYQLDDTEQGVLQVQFRGHHKQFDLYELMKRISGDDEIISLMLNPVYEDSSSHDEIGQIRTLQKELEQFRKISDNPWGLEAMIDLAKMRESELEQYQSLDVAPETLKRLIKEHELYRSHGTPTEVKDKLQEDALRLVELRNNIAQYERVGDIDELRNMDRTIKKLEKELQGRPDTGKRDLASMLRIYQNIGTAEDCSKAVRLHELAETVRNSMITQKKSSLNRREKALAAAISIDALNSEDNRLLSRYKAFGGVEQLEQEQTEFRDYQGIGDVEEIRGKLEELEALKQQSKESPDAEKTSPRIKEIEEDPDQPHVYIKRTDVLTLDDLAVTSARMIGGDRYQSLVTLFDEHFPNGIDSEFKLALITDLNGYVLHDEAKELANYDHAGIELFRNLEPINLDELIEDAKERGLVFEKSRWHKENRINYMGALGLTKLAPEKRRELNIPQIDITDAKAIIADFEDMRDSWDATRDDSNKLATLIDERRQQYLAHREYASEHQMNINIPVIYGIYNDGNNKQFYFVLPSDKNNNNSNLTSFMNNQLGFALEGSLDGFIPENHVRSALGTDFHSITFPRDHNLENLANDISKNYKDSSATAIGIGIDMHSLGVK